MPPREILHITETAEFKQWQRDRNARIRLQVLTFIFWVLVLALISLIAFYVGRIYERGEMTSTFKELFIKKSTLSQCH